MQWDDTEHAGFTTGTPWLKVNPNYKTINVRVQEKHSDFALNYYKKLIKLRKSDSCREIFTYGAFIPLFEEKPRIFAYERRLGARAIKVIANFGQKECNLQIDGLSLFSVLFNNKRNLNIQGDQLTLLPCQVMVLSC